MIKLYSKINCGLGPYSGEKKWPNGCICPYTGAIFHNFQTCILVHVYTADLR